MHGKVLRLSALTIVNVNRGSRVDKLTFAQLSCESLFG